MRVIGNTDMQNTEKKLHRQASGRSDLSRKDMGSKINTSNKNSGKISYSRRFKPKQRSHVKTIDSILSKRRVSEFSSNGTRNNSLNQKPIKRKTMQRFSDTNSPSRQLSSTVQVGKASIRRRRRHGKTPVEESVTQKVDRRKRRKRREDNKDQDETSRLQRRTRYMLIQMKLEQSLLDAYSGEGWNGQSREKIKPVSELQRAQKQILKYKLGIRDIVRQLDLLSSEGCIEESVFGPDGSVFHEHIFCAKCKLRDAFPDNDIILCDGTCNCAFHQKCLEPPLATENIPPEDQGWFCKFCECKIEIIEGINAHLGTDFSTSSNWQDIFKEAATTSDGDNAFLNPEDEWPSDEPEDDDYDPERNEETCSRTGSEDNVHDEASSSSSFFWTSDEEASLQSPQLEDDGSPNGGFYQGRRRQRNDVDYKKLHDEMFGKDEMENEPISVDEDWGPGRQRRRLNETDAAGTLVALCEIGDGPNVMPKEPKKKRPSVKENRRTLFRIPPKAVEKLRSVFAENELPSRDVKENLSQQLGLASEKVNKWFKNARYAAIKNRKADEVKQLDTATTIANESTSAIRVSQSPDLVALNANSHLVQSDTEVPIPKSLRRARRRNNSNSITISSKKKQHRRTALALQTNINEVSSWFSNAVSFKRKVTKLRENSIKQKQVKPKQHEKGTSENNEQLYMTEMERLCHLEAKLAEMKEVISRITHRKNHVTDPTHSDERRVMYVPVVEVKEKKDMQNTEKKLHRQASGRSGLSRKEEMGSKINTSNKNSGKISYSKRFKPKQRSHVKTIDSILSKRRVSGFSSNGTKNNSLNQKPIKRRTVQRFSDTNSPSRQLSSTVQGGASSIRRRRRRHGKNPVGESVTQKVDRRKRRKKREDANKDQNETSRLQKRTRYMLNQMKLEQSLLDAYSGEGWNGQSREKIKPVRELQRAKKKILKYKLGIRDIVRQLDLLSSEGCIEESVFGPDGSVFHEHIFCAKCKLRDAFPDNDIILCDGTCNCAFHQKCLEPPLATENIPPEDQGWFCKFCECKIEIIEGINAYRGTDFSTSSNWQDIFKEAATTSDGDNAFLNPEDEWPSDEPEDDNYDPERNEEETCSRTGSEDNMHDEASSSSSFFWTSDEGASLQSPQLEDDGSPNGGFYQGRRRQRNDVDYKKLHDEMFGKDEMENEPVSVDEDWGPGRQRGRLNETDAAGTLVALCEIGDGPNVMPKEPKKKRPSVKENRRTLFRIPPKAVEKLRSVFAENELPSRDVKENLSQQLGLASEKVNRWFKNARYAAIKNRKADEVKQLDTTITIANESTSAIRVSQSPDLVAPNANSHLVQSDTEVPIPKSLRRARRRKNSNSITISSKKKQHRKTALALQANINEQCCQLQEESNQIKRKFRKTKAGPSSMKRELPRTMSNYT